MLLLETNEDQVWITHPESGAEFLIRTVTPRKNDEIRRKSLRRGTKDEIDIVTYSVNFAQHAIIDWRGVGDRSGTLPCTPENLAKFGGLHALNVMPFIINEALDLERYRQEEGAAAKNA